ncbi:MAG: hypothetical protein H0V44_17430 [Planctomycetes bacterium]|nr:hypothetical protein [Planctomycetota bacterium]
MARALDMFAVPDGCEFHQSEGFTLNNYVIVPFLRELSGDRGAMARACADTRSRCRYVYEQHPWYCASYLADVIDEAAFLAQPYGLHARAELLICRAIRQELSGRGTEALADYRAYLALPLWQRSVEVDPTTERFAQWRVVALSKR